MNDFVVVIPARYGSTRLPGKPLLDIAGKPMVQHVYERASESAAQQVLVATDDERIVEAVKSFGGEVMMTAADHVSGTDRLAEVARNLGLGNSDIVVGVQGDEPLIPPAIINQVAENLAKHSEASIATLQEKIEDLETLNNPNVVKVVRDLKNMALYFSRAPIPYARDEFAEQRFPTDSDYFRHVGMYAYRVEFLNLYSAWAPCELEQLEKLEQLRALWQGHKIHVETALQLPGAGVDTPEDLQRVRDILA
ncbi:MAG: 3-deoxy-manno-octulosonate cytidylyltransferase [Gammaproteobacteria bacterium]|nr:MAG: 3-deoxy-manno-octulosonate cytidylyltransferase [Gammaproteobacteria bacterium]